MNHEERLRRAAGEIGDADALLVTNLTNVRYLTGFSGTNGQVLVGEKPVFLSDPRYEARAKDLVRGAEIEIYANRITDVLGDALKRRGVRRLAIEAETMTLAERDDLASRLEGVELVPVKGAIEKLRRQKDPDEIRLLRDAVALGDRAFTAILEMLTPGRTEREIALELEVFMRRNGADEVSFDPIVGSGSLSAHIHHTPGDRVFDKGDLVLLDFGSRIDGYCSDMTRTVVLGPASDEQQQIYALVLEAQRAGIEAVRAGHLCPDVDAAARRVIAEAGYGDNFPHGLGHGVGIDIHEAPRLHRTSEETLLVGDVVTVEPGIYLPGRGGIRIEDCVLVTEDGPEVLTSAPKDSLIEV
ncbi:MAG TPA: Xaa-Pro peptidase family protein [Actinomycetota bacterium]|jgi:Xaa-Pro aminopeptidase|nr:Xaa-Pro peptidase family protein [Actinomycetota bacterium]